MLITSIIAALLLGVLVLRGREVETGVQGVPAIAGRGVLVECLDCGPGGRRREADVYGRCGVCGSESVVLV